MSVCVCLFGALVNNKWEVFVAYKKKETIKAFLAALLKKKYIYENTF